MVESDFWFMGGQVCTLNFFLVQALYVELNVLTKEFKKYQVIFPWEWGGGGVLNKCLYGEAPPRGPTPYPFIYHFPRKRYAFHIPSITPLCNRPNGVYIFSGFSEKKSLGWFIFHWVLHLSCVFPIKEGRGTGGRPYILTGMKTLNTL